MNRDYLTSDCCECYFLPRYEIRDGNSRLENENPRSENENPRSEIRDGKPRSENINPRSEIEIRIGQSAIYVVADVPLIPQRSFLSCFGRPVPIVLRSVNILRCQVTSTFLSTPKLCSSICKILIRGGPGSQLVSSALLAYVT